KTAEKFDVFRMGLDQALGMELHSQEVRHQRSFLRTKLKRFDNSIGGFGSNAQSFGDLLHRLMMGAVHLNGVFAKNPSDQGIRFKLNFMYEPVFVTKLGVIDVGFHLGPNIHEQRSTESDVQDLMPAANCEKRF